MSMGTPSAGRATASPLGLDFPQSLAVYDEYAAAQKAVDFLSDNKFPVEQCMIVGTDLKRIERITGRLTTGRVALGGLLSGVWLGLFVGLVLSLFADDDNFLATLLATMLFGAVFGIVWALVGYAMARGQRDFSSVTASSPPSTRCWSSTSRRPRPASCSPSSPAACPTRSPEPTYFP